MIKRKFGSTRVVYLTKNYAFKFPILKPWTHFLQGLLGNMEEAFLYKNKNTLNYGELLCPVIFNIPGGFLTVMKRVDSFTDKEYFEKADEIKKITNTKVFITHDGREILHNSIGELKPSSWGLYKNKLTVIDYGN